MSFETGNTTPSVKSNSAEVPDLERKDVGVSTLAESVPAEVAQQTPEANVPAIPQSILDSRRLINAAANSVREGFGDAIRQPVPADPANLITVPDFAKPVSNLITLSDPARSQQDTLQFAQSNLVPHGPVYLPPKSEARSLQETREHAQEAFNRETAADLAARERMRGGLASMQRLVDLGLAKQESVDRHRAKHADEF